MKLSAVARQSRAPVLLWAQTGRYLLLAGLHNRLVLAGVAIALTGAGLAFGWGWLTAIGIAPLILSVAPCLVMCALGLCMMGRGQQACSSQSAAGAAGAEKPANSQSGSEA